MNLFTRILAILAICLVSPASAYAACGVVERGFMRLYGTYDRPYQHKFDPDEHQLSFGGCGREFYNQYLMIKVGPETHSIEHTEKYEFKEEYVDDLRFIANGPFKRDSYEDRLNWFTQERKFAQTCLLTEITEQGELPLMLEPQKGCNITKIDNQTATFTGSICFFRLTPKSSYKVVHKFNPKCSDKKFLVENQINPHDIYARIGYLIAKSSQDPDTEFEDIAERRVRLTLEPAAGMLSLAPDNGFDSIRFPNEVGFDLHPGTAVIREKKTLDQFNKPVFDEQSLNFNFLINNQCKEICLDGLCSSMCDRVVPVAGSVKIFKTPKTGGQAQFVDHWYQALVAIGRWQGFSSSVSTTSGQEVRTYKYPAFKPGFKYRIEADMSYLRDYYRLGIDGFRSFALQIASQYPGIVGRDPLPGLNPFPQFTFRIPLYPSFPGLPGELTPASQPSKQFWDQLQANADYFGQPDWPPLIEKYCDYSTGKCANLTNGTAKVKLWVEFEVGKFNPVKEQYELVNTRWGRTSNVFPSYEKTGLFPECREYENSLYINHKSCELNGRIN